MQLLGLVNLVPNALIDLFTTLLVLSDKSLNFLAQLALLSLELFPLKLMVSEHLLDLLLLELGDILDTHLVLGILSLLGLMKVLKALMISLNLLSLILHPILELNLMIFHELGLAFLIFTLFFFLLSLKIRITFSTKSLLNFNLLVELGNFEIFLLANVLSLIIFGFLHQLDLIVQMVNF